MNPEITDTQRFDFIKRWVVTMRATEGKWVVWIDDHANWKLYYEDEDLKKALDKAIEAAKSHGWCEDL